ncbi:MAG: squalene/phytoene synthase family protein, partial [Candidatus Nanohaloarchaea archaeon]
MCDDSIDGAREERLYDTAESFGLTLQLVNITKDVHADYHQENNIYLPAEELGAENVPQEEVCSPEHREAVTRVVRSIAEHATGFLDDAQTYLELAPERKG